MTGALLAQNALADWLLSPITWGLALGAIGLWLMLASAFSSGRFIGKLLGSVGLAVVAISMPALSPLDTLSQWGEQFVFWLLAGVAVVCSAAAVTARNPVYTAIWFAGSLLGVSGLFMFQHAQFLAVTTVVVYAGAIVVTFLFVLMLANPEGHARYDRISWSKFAVPTAILGGAALLSVVVLSFSAPVQAFTDPHVVSNDHMVHLGTELFSKYLIEVEVAGTLLLVAFVGAVAIVIQGKEPGRARRYSSSADGGGELNDE